MFNRLEFIREEFCFFALLGFCSIEISLYESELSRSISIQQKFAGFACPNKILLSTNNYLSVRRQKLSAQFYVFEKPISSYSHSLIWFYH
jgi:hypothetical protein